MTARSRRSTALTMMETALQRDVLSARAGMLRNYDPLVQQVNALRQALGRLRDNVSDDAAEAAAIDRLAAEAARQEELTEQFKSANALLQNSLAYFPLAQRRLAASDRSGPAAPAVSSLAAAMMRLTLDTSPAVRARGRRSVERTRRATCGSPAGPPRCKSCWRMADCFTTCCRKPTACSVNCSQSRPNRSSRPCAR